MTKERLLKELAELRLRVAGLEEMENEHKLVEEELRKSEVRFRAVFETAEDSIFIKDRDLKYTLVNPAMERLFGRPAAELLGLTDSDLFGEDAGASIRKEDSRVIAGETIKAEHAKPVKGVINTFDVIRVPIHDRSGKTIGLCGIARNITERKRDEESLKLHKNLLNQSNDATFVADPETGRILDVNDKTCSSLGYDRGELLLMRVADIEAIIPDDFSWERHVRELKEQGVMLLEGEHKRKDGTTFPVEVNVKFTTQEERPYLVAVVRDITERKKAEEALKESQEQLRSLAVHLQHIQEKERGRIARDIHDEFGQLLTALKYDLSWMKKRLYSDQRPLAELSDRMLELIDNAIKTVQKISSELRPTLLDDLGLVAAIEWYAEEFQNRTETRCRVLSAPEEIILDKDLSTAIFRAFQEALTNVARHADATMVGISLTEADGNLTLKVTDNGKGIGEKDSSDSKSLGLIGIRERFHPWGGEVIIDGKRGEGTSVTVNIPFGGKKGAHD